MGFKERPVGGEAKRRKPTEGTESQAHNAGFPQRGEGTSFTFDMGTVKSPNKMSLDKVKDIIEPIIATPENAYVGHP